MTSMEATLGGVVPVWTVGDRLRKARTWSDITVETMADDIGRSARTIRNYEAGATTAPLLVLRQYAMRTGVPLRWLETGEMPSTLPHTGGYEAVDRGELVAA